MARGGLMTALQAALAGVSGGAAGYAKYQQQEQEKLERQQEMERQRLRDALAQSQLNLSTEEFKARYGPEAIARQERERREDIERRNRERAEDIGLEREKIAAQNRRAASDASSARQMQREQNLGEAEAWWNRTMSEQAGSPEAFRRARRIADTFNRLRSSPANKNKDPREIFLSMYETELAADKARTDRAKLLNPEQAGAALEEPEYVPTEEAMRLRTRGGTAPSATPAAAPTASQSDRWEQLFQELLRRGMDRAQAAAEATRRVRG